MSAPGPVVGLANGLAEVGEFQTGAFGQVTSLGRGGAVGVGPWGLIVGNAEGMLVSRRLLWPS